MKGLRQVDNVLRHADIERFATFCGNQGWKREEVTHAHEFLRMTKEGEDLLSVRLYLHSSDRMAVYGSAARLLDQWRAAKRPSRHQLPTGGASTEEHHR